MGLTLGNSFKGKCYLSKMDPYSTSAPKDPESAHNVSDLEDSSELGSDEDKVNKYFYKLYVSQITTDQMIGIMHRLSNSPEGSRNRSVFNTMLKILFNECRFFPKYPIQELAITAELFGKMIKHGLLLSNGSLLFLALRCILEALKRGKTSKMFQFGTIALSQLENSIASYPWFSTALLGIPDVRETFPQLYKTCEKLQSIMTEGMQGTTYVDQARGIVITPDDDGTIIAMPSRNSSLNICSTKASSPKISGFAQTVDDNEKPAVCELERLMATVGDDFSLVAPSGAVMSQIYAIFNNMCLETVPNRAREAREILRPENNSWLLLYIIRTRASKEQNLHEVFVSFIENMRHPKLFELAIQITYACISACLKSLVELKEKSAYRTLLKNLGSWLGRITLSRNVPIISRHLDIKQLLFNAHETGAMVAILPFVCKAMEGIKNSKIFRPPNPWTTAILTFLVEIHTLPNLKMSLVFEVEILFKHLELDISQFANKTNLLENKTRMSNSPDFESETHQRVECQRRLENVPHTSDRPRRFQTRPESVVPSVDTARCGRLETGRERLNQLLAKVMCEGTGVMRASSNTPVSEVPSTSSLMGMNAGITSADYGSSGNNELTRIANQGTHSEFSSKNSLNLSTGGGSNGSAVFSSYSESLLQGLQSAVVISPTIALFEIQPQLRALVPLAIERAVRKVLPVVSDHAISISRASVHVLISKDFSGEEEESVLRGAVRLMFEQFATSLVLATCKEPLRIAFHESLRSVLQTHRTQDCNDQVLIEQLVQIISQDNLALSVGIAEKIVAERARNEAEALSLDLLRIIKVQPPSKLVLPPVLQHWNITSQCEKRKLNVYRAIFQRSHAGVALPMDTAQARPHAASPANISNNIYGGALALFEECFSELWEPLREIALFPPVLYSMGPTEPGYEPLMFSTHALLVLYSLPVDHELFTCIAKCLSVMEMSPYREPATVAIAHRLLMFLCEGFGAHAGLNVEVLLCVLDGLYGLNPSVKQTLASVVFSLPLDQMNNLFNVITVTGLLRYDLLDWAHLTHYLTLAMEKGENSYAVEMAIVVTAIALIDQRSAPPEYGALLIREIANVSCGSEACKTYPGILLKDVRAKLLKDFVELQQQTKPMVVSLTPVLKKNLSEKIKVCKFNVVPPSNDTTNSVQTNKIKGDEKICDSGFGGVRRVPPPPVISESHRAIVAIIFSKWTEYSLPYDGESLLLAWRQFFQRFNLQGLFKMDGGTDNFLTICVHSAIGADTFNTTDKVNTTHLDDGSAPDEKSNGPLALAKMADVMLRLVGGSDVPPSSALQKVLVAIASLILYGENHAGCQRLWKVLLDYFDRVETPNQVLCKITFLHALQVISPIRAPLFAHSWMYLIAHKSLLPNALRYPKCWPYFAKLFLLASSFFDAAGIVESTSKSSKFSDLMAKYYNLVVSVCSASSEFVVDYYFVFGGSPVIERLAGSCHTGRSAVNLFGTQGLPIDRLPEMRVVPKLPHILVHSLVRSGLNVCAETVLRLVKQTDFPLVNNADACGKEFEKVLKCLEEIIEKDPGQCIFTLTAFVLYVGVGHSRLITDNNSFDVIGSNTRLDFLLRIMRSLSLKGKYLMMRAICRHLRFPNAHTHFFACLILWMFDELKAQSDEKCRQVVLRVLLESFIAPGRCPWGIKLVVVELFRNPRFNVFSVSTTSPRVRDLFESISHICADV